MSRPSIAFIGQINWLIDFLEHLKNSMKGQ